MFCRPLRLPFCNWLLVVSQPSCSLCPHKKPLSSFEGYGRPAGWGLLSLMPFEFGFCDEELGFGALFWAVDPLFSAGLDPACRVFFAGATCSAFLNDRLMIDYLLHLPYFPIRSKKSRSTAFPVDLFGRKVVVRCIVLCTCVWASREREKYDPQIFTPFRCSSLAACSMLSFLGIPLLFGGAIGLVLFGFTSASACLHRLHFRFD